MTSQVCNLEKVSGDLKDPCLHASRRLGLRSLSLEAFAIAYRPLSDTGQWSFAAGHLESSTKQMIVLFLLLRSFKPKGGISV